MAFNPAAALAPYTPTLWQLLLTRLRENKGAPYRKLFVHVLCVFVLHYGAAPVYEALDGVSRGVVSNLVTQVWEPAAAAIAAAAIAAADEAEARDMLVGGTRLLCETPIAQAPETWGKLLKALLALLGARGAQAVAVDLALDDEAEDRGFDSAYSKLAFCQLPEIDHCKEVSPAVAPLYFVRAVAGLCGSAPGRYLPVISAVLDEGEMQTVGALAQQQGAVFV